MDWIILITLGLATYLTLNVRKLLKGQVIIATFLEEKFKEFTERPEREPPNVLAYGWFDAGWPVKKMEEEERAPIENPTHANAQDQFSDEMWLAEYHGIDTARERVKFLRDLKSADIWLAPELLDAVFADPSVVVRAWAAGHLALDRKDYSNLNHPIKIRNYTPLLLSDPAPIVRAAVWTNPECRQLPWHSIRISETWKVDFKKMSHLERLGLMRNPELSMHYLVGLLDVPTEDLGITREDHMRVVCAGALNPRMIGSSRMHGRRFWMVNDDPNAPFEEYGKMWEISVDKWLDMPRVPYCFFKYVQTTPEWKLSVYTKLLEKSDDDTYGFLREEVIRSCDPIEDRAVLKVASSDRNEKCREVAKERVGVYTKFVGVEN